MVFGALRLLVRAATRNTPEMRMRRIKQAKLVGPAGLISMEDTLATELVQFGAACDDAALAMVDMCHDASEAERTALMISEDPIRRFWRAYQELMGL